MAYQVARYGWRPDRPDPRDKVFGLEEHIFTASQLPSKFSLRDQMPVIYDQGQLGSCTANATGAILQHAQKVQSEPEGDVVPSRLFIYYEERRLGGYPLSEDTGAEVRDGIKVAASEGYPAETDWPYDISRFTEKPPQQAYTNATQFEALEYKTIVVRAPGAPIRSAIYQKHPVAFGFPVPDYFETYDAANDFLRLPGANPNWIGGHATVLIGWDFTRTRFPRPVFEVRNSWSSDWGDAGHFWIDYEWFSPEKNLADDLWVITKVK